MSNNNQNRLTDKEQSVYDYITDIIKRDGYSPSVRDIKEALSIKSTSTVHSYLERLEKKGYIQKEPGKSRTLRVEPIVEQTKRTAKVPILTYITEGSPVFAAENFDGYIDFPLFNSTYQPNHLFAIKMKDDSMKNSGIFDGDIVVSKKEKFAESGNLAVVLIDNEVIVRKYYKDKENNVVQLHSDNPNYDPFIADEDDVTVLGKVISVLRFYK